MYPLSGTPQFKAVDVHHYLNVGHERSKRKCEWKKMKVIAPDDVRFPGQAMPKHPLAETSFVQQSAIGSMVMDSQRFLKIVGPRTQKREDSDFLAENFLKRTNLVPTVPRNSTLIENASCKESKSQAVVTSDSWSLRHPITLAGTPATIA